MSDIVERLRATAEEWKIRSDHRGLVACHCAEAAAEIDHLRSQLSNMTNFANEESLKVHNLEAEVERLRGLLSDVCDDSDEARAYVSPYFVEKYDIGDATMMARAALAEGDPR